MLALEFAEFWGVADTITEFCFTQNYANVAFARFGILYPLSRTLDPGRTLRRADEYKHLFVPSVFVMFPSHDVDNTDKHRTFLEWRRNRDADVPTGQAAASAGSDCCSNGEGGAHKRAREERRVET